MLFATLLIAAVCAQDNEKTVKTSSKSKAFTLREEKDRDIFSNVGKIELLILRNFNETSQSEFLAPLSNPNDVCYPNCSEQGPQPKLLGGNGENRNQYQKQKENNQKENNNNQKEDNQKENNNNQKEDNQKEKENNDNQKENNNNQKEDNQKENNNNQKENNNNQKEDNRRRNLAHDLAQETVSRTDQARGKYKMAAIDLKAVDNDMLGISATAKTYTTAKQMAEILGNLFNPKEFQWPKSNSDSTENEKKFFDSLDNTFGGDKLKSPVHDYNLRIVEKEDHCTKQAEHFPETFAANFTKDKWAKYNALDEKVLTPFKQKAKFLTFFTTFSETIKYDTFWDDITTDDYLEEATVKRLAVAGCKFKKIREIFKENASDFTGHGNSVASFGLSAILALAVFGL